ncbi:hypothetical protein HCA69_02580 [Listeria grandensis]|uniref:Lipoprotein n=1 Tax=Listeria grandensis TaxID=1494963 RepID=A0A7X0Y1E5_9LIST|nr:hypothetical protein [Listeria grandensis]MBC1935235.1 hypothetical protein [Listeria grandensis]
MKKKFVLTGVALTTLLLAACGGVDNTGKENKADESVKKVSSNTEDSKLVKSGPLLEIGQYHNGDNGEKITLTAIATPKQNIDMTPLTMQIKDVKLLKHEKISEASKEQAALNYNKDQSAISDPYYTVQVQFSAANTTDNNVQTNGIESITTNTGIQMDMESGLYDESVGSSLNGKVTKEYGSAGFVGSDGNINSIKIKFANIADADSYETLHDASDNIEINLSK